MAENIENYRWWLENNPIVYDKKVKYPKISIVTPSYNQGSFIEETILSVIHQNYPNLEYIIIDGGSTDQSVEIIKKYKNKIKFWISEKDEGQSSAINKGLRHCTGFLFNWLNSDDVLKKGALKAIADAYLHNRTAKVFIGNITVFGIENFNYNTRVVKGKFEEMADVLTIKQPATYYLMNAVKKMGFLNEQLHYIMDYEWFVRFLILYPVTDICEIDCCICWFRLHEESKTGISTETFELHKDSFWQKIIQQNNLPAIYQDSRIPVAASLFFYKRLVVCYGERKFKKARGYMSLINELLLTKEQKIDYNKMKMRLKLPSFLFKRK